MEILITIPSDKLPVILPAFIKEVKNINGLTELQIAKLAIKNLIINCACDYERTRQIRQVTADIKPDSTLVE